MPPAVRDFPIDAARRSHGRIVHFRRLAMLMRSSLPAESIESENPPRLRRQVCLGVIRVRGTGDRVDVGTGHHPSGPGVAFWITFSGNSINFTVNPLNRLFLIGDAPDSPAQVEPFRRFKACSFWIGACFQKHILVSTSMLLGCHFLHHASGRHS